MIRIDRPNDSATKVPKEALYKRDIFGRTILHIAVIANDPLTLRKALKAADSSTALLATDLENGWNVLHRIFFHKRMACFLVLMDFLDNSSGSVGGQLLQDLLKMKDRNGIPPVSLLVNDYKDFQWMPKHISQNNRFIVEPRFSGDIKEFRPFPRGVPDDWFCSFRGGSEAYVMGSNSNATLGIGDSDDRSFPVKIPSRDIHNGHSDLKTFLRPSRILDLRLGKYHSVLITLDGHVYSCGLGSSGRLGHGNSSNTLSFSEVAFPDSDITHAVRHLAVSNGHSLVLTDDGSIFAWGQNHVNQLGFTSVESNHFKKSKAGPYENTPCRVVEGDFRKGVRGPVQALAASKIHSMALIDGVLYAWGLNVGQMSFLSLSKSREEHTIKGQSYQGSVVQHPTNIEFKEKVELFATCDLCTCVLTETKDIFVFFLYHRIKLPKLPLSSHAEHLFDSFKPSTLTLPPTVAKIALRSQNNIFLLLKEGYILTFSIPANADPRSCKNMKYNYVWYPHSTDMRAVDIDCSADGSLIVCTRNGTVFVKASTTGSTRKKPSVTSTMPAFLMSSKNKFHKVDGVNKAARVVCDESFASFAFLRDDIDMVPINLENNDFVKDMSYFSALYEPNVFRKQEQLITSLPHSGGTTTDFLYPDVRKRGNGIEVPDNETSVLLKQTQDKMKERRNLNHYFEYARSEAKVVEKDNSGYGLRQIDTHDSLDSQKDFMDSPEKLFDGKMCIGQDFILGFHTKAFSCRSPFFRSLSNSNTVKDFENGDIKGHYDPKEKRLVFTSSIDKHALLAIHYFIYSGIPQFGLTWINPEDNGKFKLPKAETTKDYFKLLLLFRIQPDENSFKDVSRAYLKLMAEDDDGDVIVKLRDGERTCHSFMLVARCAFFETVLSERWIQDEQQSDERKTRTVELNGVTSLQFEIILRHLYGCADLEVFEVLYPEISRDNDSDEFVNFCLDLIEVCDELLLVQLKHICELAIKDLINLDNVFILLSHSYYLEAATLYRCCAWYIFNNLEALILDRGWCDLEEDLVADLEQQLLLLQQHKHAEPNIGADGELLEPNCPDFTTTNSEGCSVFLKDLGRFNKMYMEANEMSIPFDPVFDIKEDPLKRDTNRRPSRRMSRKSSLGIASDLQLFKANLERTQNSPVFADDNEEDSKFELVTRRRKSRTVERSLSSEIIKDESDSSANVTEPVNRGSESESDSQSTWASKNSSTVTLPLKTPMGPALGEAVLQETKPKTKIKFAPTTKQAKKQRMKSLQTPPPQSSAEGTSASQGQGPSNPWKKIEYKEKPTPKSIEKLPVLGSNEDTKKLKGVSLTAIMLQESLKVEEQKAKESQRKTLQDIQQEQEFAKWWEEESRRVQQELGQEDGKSGQKSGNKGKRGKSKENGRNKTKQKQNSRPHLKNVAGAR